MSYSVIYDYRIFCVTEEAYVTTWSTTEPTVCPNNNTHTIDPSKTSIINTIDSKVVTINEEAVPTGGHYSTLTMTVISPAGASGSTGGLTSSNVMSFPFNTSPIT